MGGHKGSMGINKGSIRDQWGSTRADEFGIRINRDQKGVNRN